jgi:CubicO group peptidase (beta-lactamase class C family)
MLEIQGKLDSRCAEIEGVFRDNFVKHGESGAGLCVYLEGEPLINIWAGTRDREEQLPWQRDTLVNVFSAGKGLLALAILQLVERGLLELDSPVCDYWPEFAGQGKAAITLRMLLNHQSGMAAFRGPIADDAIYDWAQVIEVLAKQAPWWEPGKELGYHPFTFGWLLGEVLRRVSGKTVGQYLREDINKVVDADCFIGLRESELSRVADVLPLRPDRAAATAKKEKTGHPGKAPYDAGSTADDLTSRAFAYPASLLFGTNSHRWRSSQIPAANMHSNAHGLAAVYGALANAGCSRDRVLLQEESIRHCYIESSAGIDQVLKIPMRFSLGFMLAQPSLGLVYGRGERCFGHPGAGGSLGFADPDYRLGFAYVTNRLSSGAFGDPRARRLIDALYKII